jgi:lipid-A-disaccharide synthase-like uncharacterized protein
MQELLRFLDGIDAAMPIWTVVGFLGQAMFASRFLAQWLHSERVGRSEIPAIFWFLSLGGGAILMIYAIHISSAVFAIGQGFGLLVYLRNLHLISRERHATAGGATKA